MGNSATRARVRRARGLAEAIEATLSYAGIQAHFAPGETAELAERLRIELHGRGLEIADIGGQQVDDDTVHRVPPAGHFIEMIGGTLDVGIIADPGQDPVALADEFIASLGDNEGADVRITVTTPGQPAVVRTTPRPIAELGRVYRDRGHWGFACNAPGCILTGTGWDTEAVAESRLREHRTGAGVRCPYNGHESRPACPSCGSTDPVDRSCLHDDPVLHAMSDNPCPSDCPDEWHRTAALPPKEETPPHA